MKTSEEQLSSLERARCPAVESLDQALSIIGLELNSTNTTHQNSLQKSSTVDRLRFRRQWVLRWLTKHLSFATKTDTAPEAKALIIEIKTWRLLARLLDDIPRNIAKRILLDRDFAETLGHCLARISSSTHGSNTTDDAELHHNDERPRKRRRLSTENLLVSDAPSVSFLEAVIDVVSATVTVFLYTENSTQPRTSNAVRWTNSHENALRFLGQLLDYSKLISSTSDRSDELKTKTVHSVVKWFQLWYAGKSVIPKAVKQNDDQLFTQHILTSALRFCSRCDHSHTGLVKDLEKQIAIHAVLPARAIYQAMKPSNSITGSRTTKPQTASIDDTLKAIAKPLVDSGVSKTLTSQDAAQIMSIAQRLVPRSNRSIWRSEMIWIEAYWSSLLRIVCPREDDNLMKVKTSPGVKTSLIDVLESQYRLEFMLNSLQQTLGQCQSQYWDHFLDTLFEANSDLLTTATLSRVVGLNPSKFVPFKQSSKDLLSNIFLHAGSIKAGVLDQEVYLEHILLSILHECIKARQLDMFYTQWHTRLHELYTNGTRITLPAFPNSTAQIWTDPKLFVSFTRSCHEHPPLPLFRELYVSVKASLTVETDTWPSIESASQLEIFNALLDGVKDDATVRLALQENGETNVSSVIDSLNRSTSKYKWLGWQLLGLLVTSQTLTVREALQTKPILTQSCPVLSFSSKQFDKVHDPTLFIAFFWAYRVKLDLINVGIMNQESFILHIDGTVKSLLNHVSNHIETLCDRPAWNGSPSTMDSTASIFSALLNLHNENIWWIGNCELEIKDLLLDICVRIGLARRSEGSSLLPTVADQCEAFMATYTNYLGQDLIDKHLLLLADRERMPIVGSFAALSHQLTLAEPRQPQYRELFNCLLGRFEQIATTGQSSACLSCLDLINSGFKGWTSTVRLNSDVDFDMSEVLAALEHPIPTLKAEDVSALFFHIDALVSTLIDHFVQMKDDANLKILFSSSRKLLKKQTADNITILSRYSHLALLCFTRKSKYFISKDVEQQYEKFYAKLQEQVCQTVEHVLKHVHQLHGGRHGIVDQIIFAKVVLETVDDSDVRKSTVRFCTTLPQAFSDGPEEMSSGSQPMLVKLARSLDETLRSMGEQEVFAGLLNEPVTDSSLAHKASMLTSFKTAMSDAGQDSTEGKVQLISTFCSWPAFLDSDSTTRKTALVAAKACAAVRTLKIDELAGNPGVIQELSVLASLHNFDIQSPPLQVITQLEISNYLLMQRTGIVNQNIIDNTLASVAVISTTVMHKRADIQPQHIIDRLCTIMLTILVRHRRRLLDRYHLVVPALQKLLLCFFVPVTGRQNHNALPTSSATKYVRVLDTLTNPSASAARNVLRRGSGKQQNQSNANLVDDVKAIRRNLSFHLQYLLQTFCQASLDSRLSPEVKEKLLPGLYSVIGSMDTELMRAMNAAMNDSQRAIWKDLYQQWTRFGKWNQK